MDRGWFKLHRKMFDNPLMKGDYLALWVWLLGEAAYETRDSLFGGKRISLAPGQLTTGRKKAAAGSGLSESQTQKLLVKMVLEQQIEQQTSSINRLITILNWSQYQQSEHQTEQQSNSGVTTTEHTQRIKELKKERIKEKAVSSVADPRRDEFIKLFFDGYKKEFRVPYVFTNADGHNLKYFLKNNPDITIDRMLNSLSGCISNEFDKKNLSIKYVLSNFSKLERLYVPNN